MTFYFCADFKINVMKRQLIPIFLTVAVMASSVSCANGDDNKRRSIDMEELAYMVEDMKSGDTLSVRGFCVDVCLQGASHITLVSDDSLHAINVFADKNLMSFDEGLKYSYVTVEGVLNEQRVDSLFLNDWEYRLDESLKAPDGGNPEAVAVLKGQIEALRDSIAARFTRTGKNYWSNYTIEAYGYKEEK